MEIAHSDATELVGQLQTAHRLSVGFYQRLLPLLNRIAGEFLLDFWSWGPLFTNRPSQSGKSPSTKWAWDLVPMFASEHYFRNEQGEHANPGDMTAVFKIYIDENFKPEKRKELGIKGEPDPLTMKAGSAIFELDLFCCDGHSQKPFDSLWGDATWPSDDNESWEVVGENMNARRLTFHLADLIAAPETIIEAVRAELAKAPRIQ